MMNQVTPCARCGARASIEDSKLCAGCEEQGPLSPDEAERYRLRLLEDDPAAELVVGETYNVRTSDQTVYRDAEYVGRSDGILLFDTFGGIARVGIGLYEFAGVV